LYILTDGVMDGIEKTRDVYCDRRFNCLDREKRELCIMTDGLMVGIYPDHYAVCHNIQLPFFSPFHDIEHHLSLFISESLMMAF
jgi:hypothetical protein